MARVIHSLPNFIFEVLQAGITDIITVIAGTPKAVDEEGNVIPLMPNDIPAITNAFNILNKKIARTDSQRAATNRRAFQQSFSAKVVVN